MRLYGYVDDEGWPTWGPLVDGGVFTADLLRQTGSYDESLALVDPGLLFAVEPEVRDSLTRAVRQAQRTGIRPIPIDELQPAAALPAPGKIVCIGLNYRDHVAEQQIPLPDRQVLFAKFANTVVAPGEPVVRPPGCRALDLEVELGVVIGRTARRVSASRAMEHVAGYVVVNDISARDWQGIPVAVPQGDHGDGQWLRAKGSDTFLPMSAVFVSADEIPDPHRLRLRSWRIPGRGPLAGQPILMQDGSTADMIFDIPHLIEFVTRAITLDPGDVIATGTPAGVGVFRQPPVFLEPGDRVRCEIDEIGSVENPVVDWDEVPEEP
jgi:2-keto-4-pentenoate hydratase/2-oxohepta-3-ene-1,7-dioic acid hydratase in catechol pathway